MLNNTVEWLDRLFQALLVCLVVVMVSAVTWQVVSRYLLGEPSSWTEELARFMLIWIGLLGGSYAYRMKMHLGLDLLSERFKGRARSVQQKFIHCVVILFSLVVLVVGGLGLVKLTYELEQLSPALGIPMAYVYLSLPISGVMLIVYGLAGLFESEASANG